MAVVLAAVAVILAVAEVQEIGSSAN